MSTRIQNKFRNFLSDKGLSIATINSYSHRIVTFLKYCKENDLIYRKVKRRDIMMYIQRLNHTNSSNSVNQVLGILRHFYSFLKVPINPVIHIDRISRTKEIDISTLLSSQDLEQLYLEFEVTTDIQHRDKVILGLLCFQGLRPKEIELLCISNIDLSKTIVILPDRKLTLHPLQIVDLFIFINEVRFRLIHSFKTDKLVFSIHGRGLKIVLSRLIHKIKINNRYILRRSVIVNWLKNNDLRRVQYWAGHKYISSTERFITTDVEMLKDGIDRFHPL